MTCIVGVVDMDCVWLGGDAAVTGGGRVSLQTTPKVFTLFKRCIVGCSGMSRGCDIVEQHLAPMVPPYRKSDGDELAWMVRKFVPALQAVLLAHDFESTRKNHVILLVGLGHRLFEVGRDFSVSETLDGYAAIGVADYALGAIHTVASFADFGTTSGGAATLLAALRATAQHCPVVSPPFTVIHT